MTATMNDAGRALSEQYWRQVRDGSSMSAGLVLLSTVLFIGRDAPAVWSAMGAVGLIWALWVMSAAGKALIARKSPDNLVLAGIGLFVLKVMVIGGLLLTLGVPDWVRPLPTAAAAVTAVIGWQAIEFRSHARSRVPLYIEVAEESLGPTGGHQ